MNIKISQIYQKNALKKSYKYKYIDMTILKKYYQKNLLQIHSKIYHKVKH